MIKSRIISKLNFKSLKTQIISSYIFISFFVLAVSAILSYNTILRILEDMSRSSAIQNFRQVELNIYDFIEEVDNLSKIFLTNQSTQYFLDQSYYSEEERLENFRDFSKNISRMIITYRYIDSIFIFKAGGEVFGSGPNNNWYIRGDGSENEFYKSNIYPIASKNFPGITVVGNFSSEDFTSDGLLNQNSSNQYVYNKINYITAIKGIKSLTQSSQTASIIVNINERELNSIYSRLSDNTSLIYIIDTDGRIVSHPDKSKIGMQSSILPYVDTRANEGSFTYENGKDRMQGVYYKMSKTGWTIVNELPYSIFTNNINRLKNIIIFSFLLSLVIAIVFYTYWINKMTHPLTKLISVMKEVGRGNIGHTVSEVPDNELGMLIGQFNKMSLSVTDLVQKNRIMEEQKRRMEVEILQSQINPHFLYNTLNTIKWMAAVIKAKNIVDSISILGNIIRPIFKNKDVLCTLREEIEYLTNYIKIMSYRYDDEINIELDINKQLYEYKVLRFILQPIVENSFIHGLMKSQGEKRLKVGAADDDDETLFIEIMDSGEGIPEGKIADLNETFVQPLINPENWDSGIGLKNVNRRIKLHFGDAFGLSIRNNQSKGFIVMVKIPKVL